MRRIPLDERKLPATMPVAVTDSALIGIGKGRRESADELVTMYGPLVWAIASSCTDCAASAEEAAVEIFSCLFREAETFRPTATTELNFVRTVAARCILKRKLIERGRIHNGRPPKLNTSVLRTEGRRTEQGRNE